MLCFLRYKKWYLNLITFKWSFRSNNLRFYDNDQPDQPGLEEKLANYRSLGPVGCHPLLWSSPRAQPHLFLWVVSLVAFVPYTTMVELNGCNRDHRAPKGKQICCLLLYRTSLPTLGPERLHGYVNESWLNTTETVLSLQGDERKTLS